MHPKELVALATTISDEGVASRRDGGRKAVATSCTYVNAADIVREVCSILGGRGGGKPNLAQGAGPDVSRLEQALEHGRNQILEALQG